MTGKFIYNIFILFLVNYASGCSIAKFPEDGVVIAQTFKDQGTQLHFMFLLSRPAHKLELPTSFLAEFQKF